MQKVFIAFLFLFAVLKLLRDMGIIHEKHACRMIFVALLIITMFRQLGSIGSDDYNYRLLVYQTIGQSLDWSLVFRLEGAIYLLAWLTGNLFGSSQPFIALEAFFIIFALYKSILRYSEYPFFSLFILCMEGTLGTVMNISRQYMAVAVLLLFAYPAVEKGDLKKYILAVLVAAWMHTSALVMIPFYWLFRKARINLLIVVSTLLSVFLMSNFSGFMGTILESSRYQDYIFAGQKGMNVLRAIKDIVQVGIIYIVQRDMNRAAENSLKEKIMMAACIVLVPITLAGTINLYVYRFSSYFSIGTVVLLPTICNRTSPSTRRLLTITMILLYIIYGWYSEGRVDFYHNILFETLEYGTYFGAEFLK